MYHWLQQSSYDQAVLGTFSCELLELREKFFNFRVN